MSSSTGYQSMMAAMPEDIEKGGQTRKDYQEFQELWMKFSPFRI